MSVFYISNRKKVREEITIKNLVELGFPVHPGQVLLRDKSRSKKDRRKRVLSAHRIVLLMGDTLGDFHDDFEHRSQKERNHLVKEMREEFGNRFIVLPNPMYGDWMGAIYGGGYSASPSKKAKLRKKAFHLPSSMKEMKE